jgi:hypothetical protein
MALSPNYSWAEPDNSSLVKNGAQDIRALGDAIDTSVWNIGFGQAGKNKIINGDFNIWQRGTSFSNTNQLVYTADRWQLNDFGGQVSNVARSAFTAGAAPVAGYESQYYATWSRAGAGTASSYLTQKVEDVRTFAGNTVTFSFWAKAAATESVDFYIDQNFGSGGSATVGSASTTFSLTTSWVRYTATVALASITGKTVGTSSFIAPTFQVQTSQGAFTIDIWGVQLEYGSKATPFDTATGTIQGELAACQRYYQLVASGTAQSLCVGAMYGATAFYGIYNTKVTMRTTPTLSQTTGTNYYTAFAGNATDDFDSIVSINNVTPNQVRFDCTSGISLTNGFGAWIITNNAASFVALQAEL